MPARALKSASATTLIEIMIALTILAIVAGLGLYFGQDIIGGSSDTVMREQAVNFQGACNQWLTAQPSLAGAAKSFRVVSGSVTTPQDPAAFLRGILPYLSAEAATSLQVDSAGHFSTTNMRTSGAYMTVNWSTNVGLEMQVQLYLPPAS